MKDFKESEIFASLKDDIREQSEFIKSGIERIKKYYTLPIDKREKETGLKQSPHVILAERSANLIGLGLNNNFDYILIGVGTEILLKAILLKEDTKYFIENINGGNTPSFNKCKGKLIEFLNNNLTDKQLERIKDILELLQQKRNNLVHLSFHKISDYKENYQVANVLRFLFLRFFKDNSYEIVEKLENVKKKNKVTSGMDYEPIEFDEYV